MTRKKRQLYLDDVYNGKVPVFAGSRELLRLLFSKGRKIYIVTSASKKTAQVILDVAGFRPFVNVVITSQDVEKDKPYPDIFLLALKKSRMDPEDVMVIEDSLSGRTAAEKAEIDTILVNQELMDRGPFEF